MLIQRREACERGSAAIPHTDNAEKVDESRSFQPQELQFSRISSFVGNFLVLLLVSAAE